MDISKVEDINTVVFDETGEFTLTSREVLTDRGFKLYKNGGSSLSSVFGSSHT